MVSDLKRSQSFYRDVLGFNNLIPFTKCGGEIALAFVKSLLRLLSRLKIIPGSI
ncbi:hypothetical protein [Paenibacillus prosopidis]|uniref:hypothetical protein n=1 Tax=Paenibacillus prosopidis TaxID=630520 RepID=UPI003CCC6AD9